MGYLGRALLGWHVSAPCVFIEASAMSGQICWGLPGPGFASLAHLFRSQLQLSAETPQIYMWFLILQEAKLGFFKWWRTILREQKQKLQLPFHLILLVKDSLN